MSSVSSQVRDPGNGARWTLHPLIFSSLAHVRRASRLSLAATLGGGKTKRVTEPARLANLRATRARPPTPAKSQKAEQRQGSATAEPHRAVLSPGGAPSSVVRTLVQLGTSRSTRRRAGPRSGCDGHTMVIDAVAMLQNCLSEPVSERAGSPPTRRHARPAFHAATADAAPALRERLTIRPRRWRRRTAQRKNKKEASG